MHFTALQHRLQDFPVLVQFSVLLHDMLMYSRDMFTLSDASFITGSIQCHLFLICAQSIFNKSFNCFI